MPVVNTMDLISFLVGALAGLAIGLALWLAERRTAAARLAATEDGQARLRDAFAALSADALHRNNQMFLDLARTKLGEFQAQAQTDLDARRKAIDDTLKPVQESLARVDTHIKEVEKARAGAYGALTTQVEALALGQKSLQTTTGQLVQALRSPNVRGLWGEMQLRRVIEAAGMLEHCDFDEKVSVATEAGRRTPDVIVHLPGGRQIVIDAKVPIDAFMKAIDAGDDSTREQLMKEHTRQLKAHMESLGRKAYWEQFQPTPQFVFMFLPGETLLGAALEHDPALLEFGVRTNVIPATPLTLIALLRAVAYGWQQARLAENAEEISRLGRDLYERINVVARYFAAVGKNLKEAMDAFNKAVGSIETRLLVTARRLKDLGASSADEVPEIEPVDVVPREFQENKEN
jgi:DNA recombination protein RmuC